MDVAEQTELYAEYIVDVREHNEANDVYSSEMNQLASERSRSIEAAIAQHMTPLIQLLNWVRIGGVVGMAGAGIVFCFSAAAGADQLDESFLGSVSYGFLSFVSIVIGLVSLIAVAWTGSRVSDLENKVKQARASGQG
jgi:hypothetical protein